MTKFIQHFSENLEGRDHLLGYRWDFNIKVDVGENGIRLQVKFSCPGKEPSSVHCKKWPAGLQINCNTWPVKVMQPESVI